MGLFGKLFSKRDKVVNQPRTTAGQPRTPNVKFDQSRVTAAVEDEDAAEDRMAAVAVALGHLVDAALNRLSKLPQPAVLVADPHVMDNRGDMLEWLAVQLGHEEWVVRSGQDTMGLPTCDDLATAHDALMFLEQARWRELAAIAFHRPNPSAAVVLQHGARWLVVDNRLVFLIGRSSELLPVGEMYGFNERLGKPNPVLLDVIEPDAWDALFAAMPGFPVETLVRGDQPSA